MKYYFVLILFAFGCRNSESPYKTIPENNANQLQQETLQKQTPLDTSMKTTTDESKPIATKPFVVTHFTTYPQIKRHLFTEGSTRSDVEMIQGKPELIENYPHDDEEEVWYYGECEIIFRNGLVDFVKNSNTTIKYVSYHLLLLSDNPVDQNMGRIMASRAANNVYYNKR